MIWLAAALASSMLAANNAENNRRFQQEGFRLNLWRTLLITLFWAPLAMIMPWPDDWRFYAAAVFGGVGMIIGNKVQADLSARHNGRVAILHMPVKALFVYVMWLLIDPAARAHVLGNPEIAVIVLLCFTVMVMAMNAMRSNDASWDALRLMLPVVVFYGLGDIFTKFVITPEQMGSRLVIYLFLMSAVSAVASLAYWPWRPRPEVPFYSRRMLEASAWAATSSALNHVCFMIALVYGPNPAYASMISLLAPVWLLIYHRVRGIKDDAKPGAGLMLVGAAIILMWATH